MLHRRGGAHLPRGVDGPKQQRYAGSPYMWDHHRSMDEFGAFELALLTPRGRVSLSLQVS